MTAGRRSFGRRQERRVNKAEQADALLTLDQRLEVARAETVSALVTIAYTGEPGGGARPRR